MISVDEALVATQRQMRQEGMLMLLPPPTDSRAMVAVFSGADVRAGKLACVAVEFSPKDLERITLAALPKEVEKRVAAACKAYRALLV